jgi:hypothetical protein
MPPAWARLQGIAAIRRRFYDLGTVMATLQIDAGKTASSDARRKS